MKKFTLIACLLPVMAFCQDITGHWNGTLAVAPQVKLHIVVNVEKTDTGYHATLDSPDQGAKGIPINTFTLTGNLVNLESKAIHATYTGEYKGDSITGTFTQQGHPVPLALYRGAAVAAPKRPQEPHAPFPYYTEDVTFSNPGAQITLAGTLSLPKKEGRFPAVILISGSGPQNRDEELLGHKPFAVLADHLTRQGIAVLRYDDRGTAASTGKFLTATSQDFANDAASAIAYLKTRKEIKQIGLMGHSEGGVIAPMVAATNKDVAFIVMLAGTGITGDQIIYLQNTLISRAEHIPESTIEKNTALNKGAFDIIKNNKSDSLTRMALAKYFYQNTDSATAKSEINALSAMLPWMKFFLAYDPVPTLKKVHCPVLAINGAKDLQVPASANLPVIEKALKAGGNKDVTIREYPNLNHLFQEANTGSPTEYSNIEQTFSPQVMDDITKWILKRI